MGNHAEYSFEPFRFTLRIEATGYFLCSRQQSVQTSIFPVLPSSQNLTRGRLFRMIAWLNFSFIFVSSIPNFKFSTDVIRRLETIPRSFLQLHALVGFARGGQRHCKLLFTHFLLKIRCTFDE